jgi:hypothetical protein
VRPKGTWSGVLAIALVVGGTLTGCASRVAGPDPAAAVRPHSATPSARIVRDVRLFGFWTATVARVIGKRPLLADSSTTASLEFRRDGAAITNDDGCRPATRFTTSASHIDLHWPASSFCYGTAADSRRGRRIAHILDKLTSNSHIAYSLDSREDLTVAAGRYQVVLRHGRIVPAPPTIGPSTPVPGG